MKKTVLIFASILASIALVSCSNKNNEPAPNPGFDDLIATFDQLQYSLDGNYVYYVEGDALYKRKAEGNVMSSLGDKDSRNVWKLTLPAVGKQLETMPDGKQREFSRIFSAVAGETPNYGVIIDVYADSARHICSGLRFFSPTTGKMLPKQLALSYSKPAPKTAFTYSKDQVMIVTSGNTHYILDSEQNIQREISKEFTLMQGCRAFTPFDNSWFLACPSKENAKFFTLATILDDKIEYSVNLAKAIAAEKKAEEAAVNVTLSKAALDDDSANGKILTLECVVATSAEKESKTIRFSTKTGALEIL